METKQSRDIDTTLRSVTRLPTPPIENRGNRANEQLAKGSLAYDLQHPQKLWRASDRLRSVRSSTVSALSTGHPALDALLPDGGWPRCDLVELLCNTQGIGELRFLMPVLRQLSHQEARWIAWIAPPHIPYAPALKAHGIDVRRVLLIHPKSQQDSLWAADQALKSGTCSAVLCWFGENLRQQDIRRLQIAASVGRSLALLFRSEQVALEASPAPFRFVLRRPQRAKAKIGTTLQSKQSTITKISSIPLGSPASKNDVLTDRNSKETNEKISENDRGLQIKVLKRRGGWATDFFSLELTDHPLQHTLEGMQQQWSLWRLQRRSEYALKELDASISPHTHLSDADSTREDCVTGQSYARTGERMAGERMQSDLKPGRTTH